MSSIVSSIQRPSHNVSILPFLLRQINAGNTSIVLQSRLTRWLWNIYEQSIRLYEAEQPLRQASEVDTLLKLRDNLV